LEKDEYYLGQFGEIKEGIHFSSNQRRAIKVIKKSTLLKNEILKNDLLREYTALKKLVMLYRITLIL